jgi:hypothetical protein
MSSATDYIQYFSSIKYLKDATAVNQYISYICTSRKTMIYAGEKFCVMLSLSLVYT